MRKHGRVGQASIIVMVFLMVAFITELGYVAYIGSLHEFVYQQLLFHEDIDSLSSEEHLCVRLSSATTIAVTNTGSTPSRVMAILDEPQGYEYAPAFPSVQQEADSPPVQPGNTTIFKIYSNYAGYAVVTSYGNTFETVNPPHSC